MRWFGKGKKEEEKADEDYQKQQALVEGSQGYEDSRYESVGPRYYNKMDDQLKTLLSHDEFEGLIPGFSHLMRLTNIDAKEARIWNLKFKILLLEQKMSVPLNRNDYTYGIALTALELLSRSITTDAFHGWKGKLDTEQVRVIRTELVKPKKKGRLPF